MKTACVRQGDVMLMSATIPKTAKRIAVRPIALGERTGHHHSLMSNVLDTPIESLVEMYEDADGKIYVRLLTEESDVSLVHQQHKAQTLPARECVYVPQVQNSDWGNLQVLD